MLLRLTASKFRSTITAEPRFAVLHNTWRIGGAPVDYHGCLFWDQLIADGYRNFSNWPGTSLVIVRHIHWITTDQADQLCTQWPTMTYLSWWLVAATIRCKGQLFSVVTYFLCNVRNVVNRWGTPAVNCTTFYVFIWFHCAVDVTVAVCIVTTGVGFVYFYAGGFLCIRI